MSHDRGCFKCHEDPPYSACKRSGCPKKSLLDRFAEVAAPRPGLTVTKIETRPTCDVCGRSSPEWGSCLRPPTECPARAAYQPGRPDTSIISVNEPGYEIVMFFKPDGSAQAIISRPGGKEPIDILIPKPIQGRCIVVERKGRAFDVVYRSAP